MVDGAEGGDLAAAAVDRRLPRLGVEAFLFIGQAGLVRFVILLFDARLQVFQLGVDAGEFDLLRVALLAREAMALMERSVAGLLRGERRVTLIYTASTDREFEREILAQLGDMPYTRHTYQYEHPSNARENSPSDLTPLLENDADNVFVVMSDNEVEVDRILAALASADTNLTSRGRTAPRFVVLGNARWNRYNNLDHAMFFKDRVVFVSTYHAKRDAEVVAEFDRDYIRAFGSLPTLYSYRGYDAALIFCPAMYNDIEYDMEGRRYTPLQSTYLFGQREGSHNHVNREWTRVNYNKDFTITIE